MSSFKNAEIGSKDEAIRRLEAGEVFFLKDNAADKMVCISYDKSKIYAGNSPFRYGTMPLAGTAWSFISKWVVPTPWESTVSNDNKVLCWCSDNDSDSTEHNINKIIALVCKYESPEFRSFPYLADNQVWWKTAIPVTREEMEEYYA